LLHLVEHGVRIACEPHAVIAVELHRSHIANLACPELTSRSPLRRKISVGA
jgi:hypothetical protein